jgi:hypothetical protein
MHSLSEAIASLNYAIHTVYMMLRRYSYLIVSADAPAGVAV